MNGGARESRGVPAAVEAVIAALAAARDLKSTTLANRSMRMRWFAAFVEATGIHALDDVTSSHVQGFIDSLRATGKPASRSEQGSRLGAVTLLYREARRLGLATTDPARDIALGPRVSVSARPLSDPENAVCRLFAQAHRETRPAVCWALAEATATTSEIAAIRHSDLDLVAAAVWLHGGRTTDPRWGRLTDWGLTQLKRRCERIGSEESVDPLLMGEGRWDEPDEGRAAATMALVAIIKRAGLASPGVNPRSIRAWAGAKALAEGASIDAVARMLGVHSLDQAAAFIGFDWRRAA